MLALLHFQVMPDREDRIPEAHSRTFNWLLENKRHSQNHHVRVSVKDWLQEKESGIYWVTGKPGSGKSTLMKYLYHHPLLLPLLKNWAGSEMLITAGFYFWNSGSAIQMSLTGLLRTLLHACFSKDISSLIPAMAERWNEFLAFGGGREPFTETELCRILDRVLSDASRQFFFLIDGLDEFEGDPSRIIQFVLRTSRNNVKLCVASRPWLAFEDAFNHRPSLLLEELTRGDIATYVASHFEHNTHFTHLHASDRQGASDLLSDVVSKASGVFLWVYLVVQSLLEGLQNADSLSDLHSRLDALPEGLEDLFDNLLGRLGSDDFRKACETFRLLQVFRNFSEDGGPSLIALYFAEDHDTRSSLQSHDKPLECSARMEAIMGRRLVARCRGFLEVPGATNNTSRVGFLHRTARDFIESESYWPIVLETTGEDTFEPDKIWVNALLWLQRTSNQKSGGTNVGQFVRCADIVEKRTGMTQRTYLDAYYYNQRHRHENSTMAYNTEMLGFWFTSAKSYHLDTYMCSILARMNPRYRRTHGLKYATTVLGQSSYPSPLMPTISHYRIPRIFRWLHPRPKLPPCE